MKLELIKFGGKIDQKRVAAYVPPNSKIDMCIG